MLTEAILIRHAESNYNINATDDLDSELTPKGIEQAKGLARYLANSGDADGYNGLVSPFKRTLQTAQVIYDHIGIDFKVLPSISEYGAIWSRIPFHVFVPERKNEYPDFNWSMYDHGRLFTSETFQQMFDRLEITVRNLSGKHLFVSHGSIVYTIIDILTNYSSTDVRQQYSEVTNASVTKVNGKKIVYRCKQEWKGN